MENQRKQMYVNLIGQVVAFLINFGINFFLTPYIIEQVGREAYGFVSLGNNFVTYASVVSVALNSMSGRFIALRIHQDDYESANKYYASVIFSNMVLAVILSVPFVLIVIFLDQLIVIESGMLFNVQILWSLLFINFVLSLITSSVGVQLFTANRIDIKAKKGVEANLLRGLLMLLLFAICGPHLWFIGIGAIVCSVYGIATNFYYARKLVPQIRFCMKNVSWTTTKELLSSGVWNSIRSLGSIALTELDLLISNLFISPAAMGTLSIAKTVPSNISNFMGTICVAFMPQLTIEYAKCDKKEFVASIKRCIRIHSFFVCVIYGTLFALLEPFFVVWLPEDTTDIHKIYILAILSVCSCLVTAVTEVLFSVCTVINKVRYTSILVVLTGLLSLLCTYLALRYTSLELYAVAGISSILCIIRSVMLLVPYVGKAIGEKWHCFYIDLFRSVIMLLLSIAVGFMIKQFILREISWLYLILSGMICVFVLGLLNGIFVLDRNDRKFLFNKFKRKGTGEQK